MSRLYPAPDYKPKYRLEPVTVSDLMKRAGPLADAVKSYVEWGAVSTWQMKGSGDYENAIAAADLSGRVASLSVVLTSEAQRHEAGWPVLSGMAVTPALYGYSTEAQCEARQVAADVHALWEQAGRPHIDAARCKDAYRYLVACVRSGLIDPLPGISPVDMEPAPAPRGHKRKHPAAHEQFDQHFNKQENQ